MVAYAWGRGAARIGALLAVAGWMTGCATTEGGPYRLYSVTDEVSIARARLDAPGGLIDQYRATKPTDDVTRTSLRNEIIGLRMYVIDVEYSDYEAALTSERQKFQFASSVAGQGLNTAGALFAPATTTRILTGAAGAVGATKGYYDSDLVVAKTIQIVEGQMRAKRDTVAQRILKRRDEPAITYPLSAAMSDLEDYYRAGTFNSGLIEASAQSGTAATDAADQKALVVTYGTSATTEMLKACLRQPGARNKLVMLLTPQNFRALGALMYDVTPKGESDRTALLIRAKAVGICR